MSTLVVDRKSFADALKAISPAVATKGIIPTLQGVLLDATTDRLRVCGTDLNIWSERFVPVGGHSGAGSLVVSFRRLDALVRGGAGDKVELTINEHNLQFRCGGVKAKLSGIVASEFLFIAPAVGEVAQFSVPASALMEGLAVVRPAICPNKAREAIHCVNIRSEGNGGVVFAAYSGTALSDCVVSADASPFSILVSPTGADAIVALLLGLDAGGGDVAVMVDRSMLSVGTSEGSVSARLVEGAFFEYESKVPHTFQHEAGLDREALVGALRRVAIFAPGRVAEADRTRVRFTCVPGMVVVSAGNDAEGSIEEKLESDFSGEPFEIDLSAYDTLMLLGSVASTRVWFGFNETSVALREGGVESSWRGFTSPFKGK